MDDANKKEISGDPEDDIAIDNTGPTETPENANDGEEPSGEPAAEEPVEDADKELKRAEKLKRAKRRKRKMIILYSLLGISIAAVLVCAVGLGVELYTARKSIAYYEALSADIVKRPGVTVNPGTSTPSATPAKPPDTTGNPENPVSPENPSEELPVVEETPWIPYVDFEALDERFPGIVAWIKLDGTLLDYPIMQGNDNAFYLSHLPDGTRDRAGAVFLDYRNNPEFTDKNSLLYGHMSRTGEMFGALKEYRNQAFYDEHPVINLYTSEHDYDIVLIAGYLVDSGVETPPMSFRDDAAFERYISNLKRRSVFRSDVETELDDRLVCLCTCAYDFTNARLVIVGKLVEVIWDPSGSMSPQ